MLDRFFNFQENPFNLTPDPRFFYANPMYQEAYDELSRSLQQSKGYLALTGETGVGKTTLLKTLINGLDKNYRSIYFEYSNLGFDDFLGLACNKLGVATEGKQPQQALREFLLVQSQRGIIIVFFIDEAQNFPPDSLAQILDFTDSLGTERHLLQIVLSGQPQLEAQLALPELHALRDRLALHCRLSPLPDEEVAGFIRHRLTVAGNSDGDLLTTGAIQQVSHYAQGRPRLINVLCSRALVTAYASSQSRVSSAVMDDALRDLLEEQGESVGILPKIPDQVTSGISLGARPKTSDQLIPKVATPSDTQPGPAAPKGEVCVVLPWKEDESPQGHHFINSLLSIFETTRNLSRRLKEKLLRWHAEEPIGLGRGAAIAALVWLLIYPGLKQAPADADLPGADDRMAQRATAVEEPVVPAKVLASPQKTDTPEARNDSARITYVDQQEASEGRIETAAFEVISTEPTSTATQKETGPVAAVWKHTPGDYTETRDGGTYTELDNERRELKKKLHTSEEELEQVKAELEKTRMELDRAQATIRANDTQIKMHVSRLERLRNTTNELKYKLVSFPEHLALRNISKPKPSETIDLPVETIDLPVQTIDQPIEPIAQPIERGQMKPSAKPKDNLESTPRIEQLLARADDLMQARHLTTPAGNNAFEIFQRVLAIDPENKTGLSGIEKISLQYLAWAARAKRKNDWLNAGTYYEKALLVDPSSQAALAGLREVSNHASKTDPQIDSGTITKSKAQQEARQRLEQLGIPASAEALLQHAEQGNNEAVELLLKAGLSPNSKLSGGWTPLMSAATHGHIEVVNVLLEGGADANIKGIDNKTALTAAAWNGHTDVVKKLLANGARINERSTDGWTALMYAAWNGHRPVVEVLLRAGAQIGVKDANDWTALTAASSEGHVGIVRILQLAEGSQ